MHRLPLLLCLTAIAAHAAEPIRVACLGDSITAGAKVKAATESYPAQLQQMLGAGFVVKNFGTGGATLWHGGKPNAFQQLPDATAFAPQLAIVMFGINDTRGRDVNYWGHFAEFDTDAKASTRSSGCQRNRACRSACRRRTSPTSPACPMNARRTWPSACRASWKCGRRSRTSRSVRKRGVELVDLHAATEKRPTF